VTRLSREDSRSITQEKLRTAALQEFARWGFGGAAIDKITESAGFSRGAFYANYKSKEDILIDVLKAYNNREIQEWRQFLAMPEDIDTVLDYMRESFTRYLGQADWGMFVIEAQLHAKRNKDFAAKYRGYLNEVNESVRLMLSALYSRAGVAEPPNFGELAVLLRALVVGLSLDVGDDSDPSNAPDQLMYFLKTILHQA
jgi:AcrR family transcriptional regulator